MEETLYAPRKVRTVSGQYVDAFETDPDTILIEDIAHALSCIPRFGGHLPEPLSVAQHCVMCYELAPQYLKLDALLHDAAEAYLCDIPKPYKDELNDYKAVENKLLEVIGKKFGFATPIDPTVKAIDTHQLEREWRYCMLYLPSLIEYEPITILSQKMAKAAFLAAYESCKVK